jgi:arylsulfatase A-like enzyme
MRHRFIALFVLFTSLSAFAQPAKKPNVIFILADDLGYGDVGILYQNSRAGTGKPYMQTPHLDALAESGVILRQHYTACPVCAPARASLMTGQSQGHCAIRNNQFDKPIPDGTITLASMMKQAGYHTMIVGKWGLGGKAKTGYSAHPMKRGFDEFFGFMEHAFGHTYYHDNKHPLMDGMEDVKNKYEDVYSTDLFTARAKKMIVDHHAAHPDQPFFMYLAYTAVHMELDVPGEPYPAGSGLRGGMQWPVKPTPGTKNTWIYPEFEKKPGWNKSMRRYATMAHRLDDGVGDVMQLLKDLNIADDTLVIFTSDNGPANEGNAKEGSSDPRLFDSWGPFDGFKRDCWEGGVREPTFASWPGHIASKRTSDLPSIFYDWMPTLAEVAGVAAPTQSDGVSILPTILDKGQQRPREFLYVEYDHTAKNVQPASKDVFARKHVAGRGQQQVVRIGDYVGIRTMIESAEDPLRLYDVMKDPHEDHDLHSEPAHQDLLKRMTELLVTARYPDPGAERPYDDVPMPAVGAAIKAGEIKVSTYTGDWPWVPDFTSMTPAASEMVKSISIPKTRNNLGFLFEGYVQVPADGEYTFDLKGGGDLWLHDAHVIYSGHDRTAKVRLLKGWHPIRLAYVHKSGTPELSLRVGVNGELKDLSPDVLGVAR